MNMACLSMGGLFALIGASPMRTMALASTWVFTGGNVNGSDASIKTDVRLS